MLKSKLLGATAAAELLAIEDVFSTYLYTGTGAARTITNGIDLAGEGGLVWIKSRSSTTSNWLMDTERGMNGTDAFLSSNTANLAYDASSNGLTPNADGFYHVSGNPDLNASGTTYASWTFRKAPRFFDVVTYTGNGTSPRAISHNLGIIPGCIIVKSYSVAGENWTVYHRGLNVNGDNAPETDGIYLNLTNAAIDESGFWADTAPTSTNFTVGGNLNSSFGGGVSYVAYLFAHDPLGPSGDGSDGLIACGSYTGNGATLGPVVNLGWEPQWILVKSTSASNWVIVDNMRGLVSSGNDQWLKPNSTDAEVGIPTFDLLPNGFQSNGVGGPSGYNTSSQTYIYIAIRRGPMREPTSGTEVFAPFADTTASPRTLTTGWPVDLGLQGYRNTFSFDGNISSRLQGANYLRTRSTSEEFTGFQYFGWDNNTALVSNDGNSTSKIIYALRRAPGFFDVVAYTGNNVDQRQVPHGLSAPPEFIITKTRNVTDSWVCFHTGLTVQEFGGANWSDTIILNSANAEFQGLAFRDHTAQTADYMTLGFGGANTNESGKNYIAYLFATLPGVSKVGSYTGNGSSQTINCGFTGGARFVLIKRTDSTGDWYVWDTARGIVAGNDPHLSLNTTAAEVTTNDSIDPDSSGFIVNQVAATNINVSSASYIYFAVS